MSIAWIDRMAVDVRGPGDASAAIVFIHGLGGSINAWTPLLPALARWRCVRLELPGAGRSHKAYALGEATPHHGHLSAETHADAVLRVCEALGIARAHLVGHSFGTIIAQHVAAKEPQRVTSLALFGALAEPTAAMRENMLARAALARAQGVQGMFEIAEAISQAALSASSRETLPVAVAYVRDSIGAQDPEGFARNCVALGEARAARLELIRCPTLIVNGDEDLIAPLSGARQLASRLGSGPAQARLEVFSRCGHWPTLERPTESQRVLREFLDRVR
ncbi:MAG: alpha/beta fold hydrolase [Burkholderiales bacterium]|nr:alpha/beta fold hydrolase [Burkholderiales bacterium]